jgi:hypothetical protein
MSSWWGWGGSEPELDSQITTARSNPLLGVNADIKRTYGPNPGPRVSDIFDGASSHEPEICTATLSVRRMLPTVGGGDGVIDLSSQIVPTMTPLDRLAKPLIEVMGRS